MLHHHSFFSLSSVFYGGFKENQVFIINAVTIIYNYKLCLVAMPTVMTSDMLNYSKQHGSATYSISRTRERCAFTGKTSKGKAPL